MRRLKEAGEIKREDTKSSSIEILITSYPAENCCNFKMVLFRL